MKPILVEAPAASQLVREAMIQNVRNLNTLIVQDDHLLRTYDIETLELYTWREFVLARDRGVDVEELRGWERRRAIIELRRIARINLSGPRQIIVLRRQGWNTTMSGIAIHIPGAR